MATKKSKRAPNKVERLLEELKGVAGNLGLTVREEKLHRAVGYRVRSGVCRVREANLIVIDRELPTSSRVELLVDELSTCDLSQVYLSPDIRRMLVPEEVGG